MRYTFLLLPFLWLTACQSNESYEEWVAGELASGQRQDTLFMGYYFGMPTKAFYEYSWTLNKEGRIKEGPGNNTVQYNLDELSEPALMFYYPKFMEETIVEMPVKIRYTAWAPWNKDLFTDVLEKDVLRMLERWHNAKFRKISHPSGAHLYLCIQGNRQIILEKLDDQFVQVKYTDLSKLKPSTI